MTEIGTKELIPTLPRSVRSRFSLQVFLPQVTKFAKSEGFIVFLLFTLLTLLLTFPLIFHLGDSIIGPVSDGDNAWYVWLLWWFKHALATGQDPARTNFIFGLTPGNQIFMPTFFNEILGVPLQLVVNGLTAYNLLILLGFVLSGLTMYLLAREFVANRIACFVAGFLYDFSTYHFAHAGGHLELSTLQWLPFFVWRTFIFYRQPNLKNAVFLGMAIALVAFSALYYISYFLIPFSFLFVIARLVTDWKWFTKPRHLLLSGLAAGLALVIVILPLWSFVMVDSELQQTLKEEGAIGVKLYSADLASFVYPSQDNPILGNITKEAHLNFSFESYLFLGYISIALCVLAFAFRRNRRRLTFFWLGLGVAGAFLAAGPIFGFGLNVNDKPVFQFSPYQLVYSAPFFEGFRVPARLGILPSFAASLLAAFALDAVFSFVRFKLQWLRRGAQTILAGVLMSGQLAGAILYALPYPASLAPVPEVYKEIAVDGDSFLVLELPIFQEGSYEYYQTTSHRPTADGYLARIPINAWNSVQTVPYLSQLMDSIPSQLREQPEGKQLEIYPLNVSFKAGLREKHIKYVLLHPNYDQSNFQRNYQFLGNNLGTPFYRNEKENIIGWKVESGSSDPTTSRIRLGNEGWLPDMWPNIENKAERVVRQDGRLNLYVPTEQMQILRFKALAMFKPTTMEVRLNGVAVKNVYFSKADQLQTIEALVKLKAGENIVELHAVENCAVAHDFDPANPDTRCLAFGVQEVRLFNPDLQTDPVVQGDSSKNVQLDSGWLPDPLIQDGKPTRIVQQDSNLVIEAISDQTQIISFKAQSIFKAQTMQIWLNGTLVKLLPFEQPHQSLTVELQLPLKAGKNRLEIAAGEGCLAAHDVDPQSPDMRCQSFAIQEIQLKPPAK